MPYRFSPLGGNASFSEAIPAINANFAQLDQEAVTKTFKNAAGKNGLIVGSLPSNQGIGIILNDNDGNPAIIINVGSDGIPKLQTLSPDGTVTKQTIEGTDYYYDANGKNYMQIGILPDGSSGFAVAASGYNVADGFSS